MRNAIPLTLHGTNGIVWERAGLEVNVIYENGIFRMWRHGAHSGATDLTAEWQSHGAIRYAESEDGDTWTDGGICVDYINSTAGNGAGLPSVKKGPDGKYHMLVSRPEQLAWQYWRSDTGNAGTWSLIKDKVLGFGQPDANFQYLTAPAAINAANPYPATPANWDDYRLGNNSFGWFDDGTVWVYYEAMNHPYSNVWGTWRVGLATGPDLEHLTKYAQNPVIDNAPTTQSGPIASASHVFPLASKWYDAVHLTDLGGSLTPTSNALISSADGIDWVDESWLVRIIDTGLPYTTEAEVGVGAASQFGDTYVLEVYGVTHFFWEYLYAQTDCPSICHATYSGTLVDYLTLAATTNPPVAVYDLAASFLWPLAEGVAGSSSGVSGSVAGVMQAAGVAGSTSGVIGAAEAVIEAAYYDIAAAFLDAMASEIEWLYNGINGTGAMYGSLAVTDGILR